MRGREEENGSTQTADGLISGAQTICFLIKRDLNTEDKNQSSSLIGIIIFFKK